MTQDLYNFAVTLSDGSTTQLWDWHGKVVLVVALPTNPDSTPQTIGLDRLATTFAGQGLMVLGLPRPGSANGPGYGVSFPVAAPRATALSEWLADGESVPGYTKFLVSRDGALRERFEAASDAKQLIGAVQAALAEAPGEPPPRPDVVQNAPVVPATPGVSPGSSDAAGSTGEVSTDGVASSGEVSTGAPGGALVPSQMADSDDEIIDAELVELQAEVSADALQTELRHEDEPTSLGADLIGFSDELRDIEIDAQLLREQRQNPPPQV